ncbi:MAG: hypothetical protein HEQ32_08345 [Vampirovibrio sp.]
MMLSPTLDTQNTASTYPSGIPLLASVPDSLETLAQHIFTHAPERLSNERVLLFEGQSQYGALNYFTQCLEKAFALRGHQTERLNLHENPDVHTQISKLLETLDPTFLISFNGMHEALRLHNQKTLGEHLSIPSLSWFVDHPFTLYRRITELDYDSKINACYTSEGFDHLATRLQWSKFKGFNTKLHAAGLPHFESIKPFKSRTITLLVPCSFTPYEAKRASLRFPRFPQFERLCHDTIDYLIASPEHAADTFFLDGLEALGISPLVVNTDHYIEIFTWIVHCAEMYWRENLLKQAQNIPLTLCGKGWENASFLSDKWTVHPPVDNATLVEWYGNSQAVWNIFPLQPKSVHDRMAFCTANGANVITEPKAWVQNYFGEALTYLPQDLEHTEPHLQNILNRPIEEREAQANYGQRFTLTHRTYLNSVLDIEAILERYALRKGLMRDYALSD